MSNINQELYDENFRRHGKWIRYHDNGKLAYCYNFVHGIPHGLQESYYSDGRLMYRGYHNMGRRVGYWYQDKIRKYFLSLV